MKKVLTALRSGDRATLFAAFFYFDVSFMIWVMIGALGVYISADFGLSPAEKGLIVSIPLLGGAFFRILVGFLVDRFGPRRIGIVTLSIALVPLICGGWWATSYAEVIMLGFLLGIAGASFAVALPLASRCYPTEHQGVAMGIAGAGNSGTMVAVLVAPFMAEAFGWHAVFRWAIVPALIALFVLAWFAQDHDDYDQDPEPMSGRALFAAIRSPELWVFCAFYGVTFGGFVGLASFIGIFLNDAYGIPPATAGIVTAVAVFAGSFVRPIGGYIADRVGGLRLLIGVFLVAALLFSVVALATAQMALAVVCIILGMLVLGLGNGAVFQEVPNRFAGKMGLISGVIGAAGGLGGFFLPVLLGKVKMWTGSFSSGFFLFAAAAVCCGIIALFQQMRESATLPSFARTRIPAVRTVTAEGRIQMEVIFGG